MDFILNFLTLSRIGLVLNLAGTVMIACSFGKNLGQAYQNDQKGRRIYLASFLYPSLFRWGLAAIAVGFLLQFVA